MSDYVTKFVPREELQEALAAAASWKAIALAKEVRVAELEIELRRLTERDEP
jgi:FixJ family two-component response regulator